MQDDRIQFHLDEHIPPAIASALRRRGIEVTTASEAHLLGTTDEAHLQFAQQTGRVIVTNDDDYLRLHADGRSHAGIAFLQTR